MEITFIVCTGLAVSANIGIVISKFRQDRIYDGVLDLSILIIISYLFSGSATALSIGTFASVFTSMYLWKNPIQPPKKKKHIRYSKYASKNA